MIPTVTEGFYNLQEEMDNIMISNTTQDLELLQLQAGLSTTNANLSNVAIVAGGAGTSALTAIDIANQKNWIKFWHAPFNYNVTNNHLYLNINDTYFSIDASNNLTVNNDFGKKMLVLIHILYLVKLVLV